MMSPRTRKLVLVAHVTCSVGWLGAVASFLALALAGLAARDPERVRAAYVAMELIGWWVIVPLCFASLVTGLVQSLGTTWGLVRHYWVLIKLVLTVLATAVLLLHMQPIGQMADAAANGLLEGDDQRSMRIQLVFDAGAALVVLLVNVTLSIIKPRGMTHYGRRKHAE
jgi:uncharacterized membrane protein